MILTTFLNVFQNSKLSVILYLSKTWPHSSFHHCLECFVILICLVFLVHACLIFDSKMLTMSSSLSQYVKLEMFRLLMIIVASLTKAAFSLLFFGIKSLNKMMFSSVIGIEIVRGVWSDERYQLGWIEWLLSSFDPLQRNIRSITELASPLVLEYLVGIGLVGINKSKLNGLAIIIRLSLVDKWWGKDRSYKLSLILKSPVIIRRLLMLTSISLRCFKAKWEESK